MKKQKKTMVIDILIFTAFALTGSVFTCLVLFDMDFPFIERARTLLLCLFFVAWTAIYVLSVLSVAKRWEKLTKLFYTGYGLAIFLLIGTFILLQVGFFDVVRSVEELRKIIEEAGSLAWVAFTALQFLQVVLLPIPGMMSTAVGLAMFGPVKCLILSLIGIELGSLVAFWIGRKFGYKAVSWLAGKEELDSWMKRLKGKDSLFLTMAFLFPFFPDDILCFVAGLSSMSFSYFLGMSLVTRTISIAATCYSFDLIPFNTWWGLLIWGVILALIVLAFVFVYRNMDAILEKIGKKRK